jgi:hypothetical protein
MLGLLEVVDRQLDLATECSIHLHVRNELLEWIPDRTDKRFAAGKV